MGRGEGKWGEQRMTSLWRIWEKWFFFITDTKAFWTNVFICISNRKLLTLALQWNSVWCWWNNWALLSFMDSFPRKILIKSVVSHRFMGLWSKRPVERNACAHECKTLYPLLCSSQVDLNLNSIRGVNATDVELSFLVKECHLLGPFVFALSDAEDTVNHFGSMCHTDPTVLCSSHV